MNTVAKSATGAITLALLLGLGSAVDANDEYDWEFTLPADLACPGFTLTVKGKDSKNRVYKEWTDENGEVVRILSAGKGDALLFVNDDTGATFKLKANGSVSRTTINYDGTKTSAVTGHTVLILFPSDFPPGPTTTLYVGRVTYTVDVDGTWYLGDDAAGRQVDICAALSD